MFIEIIFAFSGFMVALLLSAKIWELKNKKSFFFLAFISRSNEQIRFLAQETAHEYTELKQRGNFLVRKELPVKIKAFVVKTNTTIKERGEELFGNIRASRFLKKSDGISEFLKNMSEKENEGRIDETLDEPENK